MSDYGSPLPERTPIEVAAFLCGGTDELAKRLGITRQAMYQWRKVPAERVLEIERITGGRVTRHDLRPDLYPLERSGPHGSSEAVPNNESGG